MLSRIARWFISSVSLTVNLPSRADAGLLGAQKVTENAKNRPGLQERANRLVGPEANQHPAMRLHTTI